MRALGIHRWRGGALLCALVWLGLSGSACRDGAGGALIAAPQAGAVEGAVRDDAGVGLAGVVVTLSDGAGDVRSTDTDAAGNFRFGNVGAGTWTLSLQLPVGFSVAAGETLRRQLDVGGARVVRQDFRLDRL